MEEVWGIPRDTLFSVLPEFQGFAAAPARAPEILDFFESEGAFRPRAEAEDDPAWKQLIPYVAVTHAGRILLLRRLPLQGETRLHHLLSIGIGGHVNPEPEGEGTLLQRGLRRELCEELEVDRTGSPGGELIGFLNDDSNAVGAVHFGLAHHLRSPEPLGVREKDRMEGRWVSREEIPGLLDGMETWSRFLLTPLLGRDF